MAPGSRAPRPRSCLVLLLVALLAAYLPLLVAFGPTRWLAIGPVAVQASRVGLYAASFGAGTALGLEALREETPLQDALTRNRGGSMPVAVLSGALLLAVEATGAESGGLARLSGWLLMCGTLQVVFCTATCLFLLGVAMRRGTMRHHRPWDSLVANSYGFYLLHYLAVTWTQHILLRAPLGAVSKAALVFATALSVSWAATTLLRRVPGLERVL